MHELAITQSLVKLVVREAEAHGAARILCIRMALGDFSDIQPTYITACFPAVSRGTAAEGAKLEFKRVRAEVQCADCGARGEINRHDVACPACGSENIRLLAGTGFTVEDIMVE